MIAPEAVVELGVDPAEVPDAPADWLVPDAPDVAAPEAIEAPEAVEAVPEFAALEVAGTGAALAVPEADGAALEVTMPEVAIVDDEAAAVVELVAAAEVELAASPCATVNVPD